VIGRALLALVALAFVAAAPAAAFVPTDPLAAKQWYLQDDHAFDAFPEPPTTLQPVKVAIVDSGVDCTLPDLQGRIVDSRSFVGGDPCSDTLGHGTIMAGVIASNLDGVGTVGMDYTAQLLVAKVLEPDGTIPLGAEAAAIRWAADSGARVINLSLGGPRDPAHQNRDTYSPLEAQAVAYAYEKGAVVVAAVGNSDEAYAEPWPYASYPAALPHVLGVSALTRSGDVPDFSNRDAVYNDISAPGSGILSTFPLALTVQRPQCPDQGYTDCAPSLDYRSPEGTSFSTPQVSAAAALLLALRPTLTNAQVISILEQSTDDVNPSTGCPQCSPGRDRLSGWGRLDVAKAVAALAGPLPPPDRDETNDDAGTQAYTLWGKKATLTASLDYYDDPVDVYRVALGPSERLTANVSGTWSGARIGLTLWRPGTRTIADTVRDRPLRAAQSATPSAVPHVLFTSRARGWYYVELRATQPGAGAYTLTLSKRTAQR
jgi:Subtilase family